jgi:hypothetical protein
MDENLAEVVQQFENHLESMSGNIAQVAGISDALEQTQAAVDDALFRRLDPRHFQQFVMG